MMVYISPTGTVSKNGPQGLVSQIRDFLLGIFAIFSLFFQSILNPDASSFHAHGSSKRGPGGGGSGGGGRRGSRIVGVDSIGNASHAAQCGGGG